MIAAALHVPRRITSMSTRRGILHSYRRNPMLSASRSLSVESTSSKPSPSGAVVPEVVQPTTHQLLVLALRSAIPMIGFGFMDNIVMIQAGEFIDASIGVTFGLSTLTAAGFGQCISDVAGFTSGGIVDAAVSKLNLPMHGLSQAQLGLKSSRIYHTAGGCVGVLIGCLLGMCSLFFMDTDRAERMKKAKELESIFRTIMVDGHKLIRAERCTLWMHDTEKKELWSKVATGTKAGEILRIPDTTGVVGAAVNEGICINIKDAYKDHRFNPEVDKATGYRTQSIIAVPIKNDKQKVIGAIQMINKKNEDWTDGVFDINDAKMLHMLSSHVSSFIKIVAGHED